MRCLRRRLAPGDGDGEYGWGERADALSEFVDCGGGVAVGVAHGDGVGDQCGVAVVADEDTRGSGGIVGGEGVRDAGESVVVSGREGCGVGAGGDEKHCLGVSVRECCKDVGDLGGFGRGGGFPAALWGFHRRERTKERNHDNESEKNRHPRAAPRHKTLS